MSWTLNMQLKKPQRQATRVVAPNQRADLLAVVAEG